MNRLLPALIAGVVLAGCATGMHRIDSSASAPSNDESFVVLGVNDEHYHVVILRGSIDEHGAFVRSEMSLGALGGSPKDGYVVGRVNAGDVVAITGVSYHNDPKSLLSNGGFRACGGVKTMVFKVPSGKVAYLGNVNYRMVGNQLD